MTVVAVVGPTASGKSALALAIAAAIDGEIVNADSMQVYRGMDIGTAKPSPGEMAVLPHHGFDVWEPAHEVSVAEFQQVARASMAEVLRRGVSPIVVGGSGLYVSAILDDLAFPGTDPSVRARWEGELAIVGPQALHARLAEVDPAAAAAILPTNGRRIVRALEVGEITGAPFTASLPEPISVHPTVRIGLDIPRDALDARIASRVEAMWAAGFVAEVAALREQGLAGCRTASRALGYQQILEFLDGRISEDEAQTQTIDATRRFARRQQRWFRRDRRIVWIPYDATDALERSRDLVRRGPVTET